jgi:hypothetical protein
VRVHRGAGPDQHREDEAPEASRDSIQAAAVPEGSSVPDASYLAEPSL